MNILITTDVIHAGGAETFVLRLAQSLKEKGYNVFLYILYKNKIDRRLIAAIAPDVTVIPARLKSIRFIQRFDGLLLRTKIDFSFTQLLLIRNLRSILCKFQIDVVHSHLFTTDKIAVVATKGLNIPVVTTMHGDYSLLWNKVSSGKNVRVLHYKKRMIEVLQQLTKIVCISEDQLTFFKRFKKQLPGLNLIKIYNGYQLAKVQKVISRDELDLTKDHFIFGMVARGIPEKGWQEVIDAFLLLNENRCILILVGDSHYVQDLKKRYVKEKNILFVGYSKNPVEYIKLFDVGLFASSYGAESLPTVLMEYLACQVPVISTDIAESKLMLQVGEDTAGLIVPLNNGVLKIHDLLVAMQKTFTDIHIYNSLRSTTLQAFAKFNMDHCVTQYIQLYKNVISEN